jgi:uncharacterized protein (DUF488 family)
MKIYTIGHSNLTFEEFAKLLQANGIKMVVDVRSIPYSRYSPQFNREELRERLERLGINYRYLGDSLGGKPRDPACYDGNRPSYEKIAQKEFYKAGIEELVQIASEYQTAIMCSEEDPHHCHRHQLIAQTLLNEHEDIEVTHIRRDGRLEEGETREKTEKQLSLFP